MKIYELESLSEDNFVDAISLVDYPAIEQNWQSFSRVKNISLAKMDQAKQIITGPAMIPNKLIYRYDETTNEEYYVWFRRETIAKLALDYLKQNRQFNTTLDHKEAVSDVFLFESWLVEDEVDKAKFLGYQVPIGTWMISMKVLNEDIWSKIESNEVRGFSIEGWFADKLSVKNTLTAANFKKFILAEDVSDEEKRDFLSQLQRILV